MNKKIKDKKPKKKRSTCTFIIMKGKNAGKRCCDINSYCKNHRHRVTINPELLSRTTDSYISINDLSKKLRFVSIYGSKLVDDQKSQPIATTTQEKPKNTPASSKLTLVIKKNQCRFEPAAINSTTCPYCHKTFSKKSNVMIHIKRNRCPKFICTASSTGL